MKDNDKVRLAIVDPERCSPKDCNLECMKACPINKIGKKCITVDSICHISEVLCIGCGQCVKKCPFDAIKIINLPTKLTTNISHRYGPNSFQLHKMIIPKLNNVVGILGSNGIGKSTVLKILDGKLKPNLGKENVEWSYIIKNYRGSELQAYFTKLVEDSIKVSIKPQYIDKVPNILNKRYNKTVIVSDIITNKYYIEKFELTNLLNREVSKLSGGELQRFCLAMTCSKEANVYVFDEPTSFLDVKQRMTCATEIRKLVSEKNYVLVVEHDLCILDLVCDLGCVMYGESGAYGVVTSPMSIKQAINVFLDGFIPSDNIRFRTTALKFNIQEDLDKQTPKQFVYSSKQIKYDEFTLNIEEGNYMTSEIIVLLGENGMGKTTFINYLAELENVSLKPQKLKAYKCTVRKYLSSVSNTTFVTEILNPLNLEYLLDFEMKNLSGGELQRVSIAKCLGSRSKFYLIDEPSAFLDCDYRIIVAKLIKRFVLKTKSSCFIVEHDLIMATYLGDKIINFIGKPGLESKALKPSNLNTGMNLFLKSLGITFRRDPNNYRPRVNKLNSVKDLEQKRLNKYF